MANKKVKHEERNNINGKLWKVWDIKHMYKLMWINTYQHYAVYMYIAFSSFLVFQFFWTAHLLFCFFSVTHWWTSKNWSVEWSVENSQLRSFFLLSYEHIHNWRCLLQLETVGTMVQITGSLGNYSIGWWLILGKSTHMSTTATTQLTGNIRWRDGPALVHVQKCHV